MTAHPLKSCWVPHPDKPGVTCQRPRGHPGRHIALPHINGPAVSWPNQKGTP